MTDTSSSTSTVALPAPGTYAVDPTHSSVGFVARHLMASKVRGQFTEFDGTIVIGETPQASSVRATVRASSITTNQPQRDQHLLSEDFLESSTYPELTLVSKRIDAAGDGHFELVADLTVHGVTKEVTFDLEFLGQGPGLAEGASVVGFEATATINRKDFGVNFDHALENGGMVVGNKIQLELNVEASTQR